MSIPKFASTRLLLLRVAAALLILPAVHAWETDQYTLPDRPLIDVGSEVSRFVHSTLVSVVDEVNTARQNYPAELARLRQHPAARHNFRFSVNPRRNNRARVNVSRTLKREIEQRERLIEQFSSLAGIASYLADEVGRPIAVEEKVDAIFGLPTDFSPDWVDPDQYSKSYYRPDKTGHVYTAAGFHRGLHAAYFLLSSTINLHGTELGIDKLGHFFNEGHSYYEEYLQALDQGQSRDEAIQAAVRWGVDSEAGIFGLIASGVYSNADLAANIAGLHFYINLFEPVVLRGVLYEPIIEYDGESYQLSARYRSQSDAFVKRFFGEHMNEALNPSRLETLQYWAIRSAIEDRCEQWLARWPQRDAQWYASKRRGLSHWFGVDYGHDPENSWGLDQVCFETSEKVNPPF